jgi:hypothetical protein
VARASIPAALVVLSRHWLFWVLNASCKAARNKAKASIAKSHGPPYPLSKLDNRTTIETGEKELTTAKRHFANIAGGGIDEPHAISVCLCQQHLTFLFLAPPSSTIAPRAA